MSVILFIVMVAFLGVLLLGSALIAHLLAGRQTAGWWAGIVLSAILLALSADQFERLPTETVRGGCSTETVVDWDEVAENAIKFDWLALAVGFALGFAGLLLFERVDLSDRAEAFLLLVFACLSLYSLIYVFAIRKLTYVVFSLSIGSLAGILLNLSFVSTLLESKERKDAIERIRRAFED